MVARAVGSAIWSGSDCACAEQDGALRTGIDFMGAMRGCRGGHVCVGRF